MSRSPARRFPENPDDPDARPRPLADRLRLLLILLLIPAVAVTVPTLVVTGIFGQRPKAKSPPPPAAAPAALSAGLTASLRRSAESLLPTPAPLTTAPIVVRVRADHVPARAQKIAGQAKTLDGTAVEGVSAAGEKHLFVDLPAGRADSFRRAVADNAPPVVPAGPPLPGAARDQLEVIVRPAADDE